MASSGPSPGVVRLSPDVTLTLDGEPLGDTDHVPRLRAFLEARPRGARRLFFQPDPRAPYAKLIAALDGARSAGAEDLGLALPEPQRC
jgi:biopolymer transport protein ExbD